MSRSETIELQKKLNWIKANKLILNSSLVFNSQRKEIAGKTWILANLQKRKAKSSIWLSKVIYSRRMGYIAVKRSI